MTLREQAQEAFEQHVSETYGWTEFAKLHTATSGEQYKAIYLAAWIIGFSAGMIHEQGRHA